MAPRLTDLAVGDDPARWTALGFAVAGDAIRVGGVALRLTGEGGGLAGWRLEGRADAGGAIDGLPEKAPAPPGPELAHPNGAIALDHVVVTTPDLERTFAALERAGVELRRVRDAPMGEAPLRQGFFVAGTAVVEVVGSPEPTGDDGPARFWGLTVAVADLDAAVALARGAVGAPRDAVQPGRRIATVRPQAGLSTPLALMSPRPRSNERPAAAVDDRPQSGP
jgi:hypothetical protein